MKNILRKLHIGGNHDGSRSHEVVGAPSSSASPSRSCATDHRTLTTLSNGAALSNSVSSGASPRANGEEEQANADYYTSEEEFQVQLALAISASNACNTGDDAESLQIKAAKRLSLGRSPLPANDTNPSAELLARRYWDYNVLDYEEKVMDGFYDVYGSLSDAGSQGKMPSLLDLQRMPVSYDLGYDIVLVNRAIDPALEQLEHIAFSIALESGAAELGPLNSGLVQRIADLVAEHMGGPVSDANEMLTRWRITSYELQASLNNIVLPLGCLQIGLSRHRALLFKVLADHVGIPCRLVKGSHYTGIDEGAVNIIKLDDEKEFIVDLMGAPGTLIPAEIPSTASAQNVELEGLNSAQHIPEQPTQDFCLTLQDRDNYWPTDRREVADVFKYSMKDDAFDGYGCKSQQVNFEEPAGKAHDSNMNDVKPVERCTYELIESAARKATPTLNGARRSPSCTEGAALPMHQVKGKDVSHSVTDGAKENPNLKQNSQDVLLENSITDLSVLFADINPLQSIGEKKVIQHNRFSDRRNNDFHRRRENISSGPGRPPLPILRKNPFICNDVAGEKSRMDFLEGLGQRRLLDARALNIPPGSVLSASSVPHNCIAGISAGTGPHASSPSSSSDASVLNGIPKGLPAVGSATATDGHAASAIALAANKCNEPPIEVAVGATENTFVPSSIENQKQTEVNNAIAPGLMNREDSHGGGRIKEKKIYDKRERRQRICERLVDARGTSEDEQNSVNSVNAHHRRLDPVLDDVAEWEIPWEDLIIGERIGLGSYGEVYHADWNGTEVAVKKFLDQDFSGDALEEFRSEVRIMRRLRHPNVVLFMGAVTRPPNLSIVTEFLPRGSLYRLIHRPNIQIDEKRRIRMALDVAKGMNCLHSSTPTIVHRDLKSPNLLVDKNWAVKVCDFGLSRMKHNTFLSSKSTAGTPEWMAPEVLRNEPSNEKCDVYSFGVILWELATLRMPWSGMNPMQVVGAVGFQNRRLDIPKETDPKVARIIWECWQNDPSLRPSFSQLMAALKPLQRLVISAHSDMQSPISLQGHAANARHET